ncbi:MAG: hypothetical protein M3020_12855, partial [Myxococcota bacterium]|nr:hypothetical protein [Myxococcota bacterium]
PRAEPPAVDHCRYEIAIESQRPLLLDVTVSCRGAAVSGLGHDNPLLRDYFVAPREAQRPLREQDLRFELTTPKQRAVFHYRVDLERMARERKDIDAALRIGGSVVAPASSFLLYPVPQLPETRIEVRLRTPENFGFTSGLERKGDAYVIQAHEISAATYSVFGRFSERAIELPGGRLDLALLDARPEVEIDALRRWVERRAQLIAEFYGRFPAPRTLLVLLPLKAESAAVVFGKLLPESAPGVAVSFGTRTRPAALERDWILLHELFHIGVPSFDDEGKWFDEGLATYFEPILRVRAGMLSELELWRELARGMRRGLPGLARYGLEYAPDYSGTYWGGAVYCLLADVELRKSSGLARGLEDAVRAVFAAGGRSSEVWSLDKTFALAERALQTDVLSKLRARHAERPTPVDLDALFAALGVVVRDETVVQLRNDAPLSAVRAALVKPPPSR